MAGDPPPMAAAPAADRVLVAATSAFLFLAPFAGSAGLRATCLIVASGALLLGMRAGLLRGLARVPRAPGLALLAWGLLAAASLGWSVDPEYTLSELRAEILYGALAFGAFFLAAREDRWMAWWLALLAGTAMVLAAQLLQDFTSLPLSRHAVSGGPGPWSTHLALVAPLLFVLAWPPPWGRDRPAMVAAVALVLLLGAAWYTQNRIVWAAFGVQLLVAVLLWRFMPAMDGARARDLRQLKLVATLAVVVAFAASVAERSERIFEPGGPATTSLERDLRPAIWSQAWQEMRGAPWLGYGFGRDIRAERFMAVAPAGMDHPAIRHAHNTFLDAAVQFGVAGVAALAALLLLLAREYVRYLRDARLAPLGILGLMIVAGFVTKNLTDDFLHRHNALVFWALNGMLLGLGRARVPEVGRGVETRPGPAAGD